jgi:hypothetical protein
MLVLNLNNYGANDAKNGGGGGGLLAVQVVYLFDAVINTCEDPSLSRQPSQDMRR